MSYDFNVNEGRVRPGCAEALLAGLIALARETQFKHLVINWEVSGTIRSSDLFIEMGQDPVVQRPFLPQADEPHILLAPIEREHIQGIVLCHPYKDWVFTWNVTRGGKLIEYLPVEFSAGPQVFRGIGEKDLVSAPFPLSGTFSESKTQINTPWRKADVLMACDFLDILSNHCEGVVVQDDYNVWPKRDFSKWVNLAAEWAKTLGVNAEELWPDQGNEA